jgi:hypothetical protein
VDVLPTLAELVRDFAGMELRTAQASERVVHEGRGHDDLSAIMQLVAVKR